MATITLKQSPELIRATLETMISFPVEGEALDEAITLTSIIEMLKRLPQLQGKSFVAGPYRIEIVNVGSETLQPSLKIYGAVTEQRTVVVERTEAWGDGFEQQVPGMRARMRRSNQPLTAIIGENGIALGFELSPGESQLITEFNNPINLGRLTQQARRGEATAEEQGDLSANEQISAVEIKYTCNNLNLRPILVTLYEVAGGYKRMAALREALRTHRDPALLTGKRMQVGDHNIVIQGAHPATIELRLENVEPNNYRTSETAQGWHLIFHLGNEGFNIWPASGPPPNHRSYEDKGQNFGPEVNSIIMSWTMESQTFGIDRNHNLNFSPIINAVIEMLGRV
ncbi:MAG: hypothetical protein HQ596_01875 [Candidatus Saganbacteria bacterium]|nr:hypothetical protein [Candidatus Saganbacteria bacterium]